MKKILFFSLVVQGTILASNLFGPIESVKIKNQKQVALGEKLFYDPLLSKNNDISCFSCHNTYGADKNKVSIGTDGKKGDINAPTIFNLKYNLAFFWNGRAKTIEEQITGPLTTHHEMSIDKETLEKKLNSSKEYKKLFLDTFNSAPTFELTKKAIAEYEKTLTTPNSKFDKFLKGETKLSPIEHQGYKLFLEYGCAVCHNGINLGGNSYQKFGSVIEYPMFETKINDRYAITKNPEDIGVYKVPSLRNIEQTSPYFHTGEVENLKSAISIMAYYNLGRVIKDDEIEAIESFLKTLTGELPESYKKRLEK